MVGTDTPESLLGSDPDAQVFYILNNAQVALCKKATDLPFHKQRSSYISAGTFSPLQKKVCFWGDAVEIDGCMKALVLAKAITEEFTYALAGGRKMVFDNTNKIKAVNGISRKGHAGFNRLPATGTDKLKPQQVPLSNPGLKQGEIKPKEATIIQTPSSKIEIRTDSGRGDLRQQNVKKTPRKG